MEIEEMAEQFRQKFKSLAASEGMTKASLARALNTSRSQIERLLHIERYNVSIDSLLQFARALHMPITIRLV